MNYLKKIIVASVFTLSAIVISATGFADGSSSKNGKSANRMNASVVGTNYCVACSLKKTESANAQCSTTGHQHALRVKEAKTADGKKIKNMEGVTLHYLSNKNGATLNNAMHGQDVMVMGAIYKNERIIDVAKIGKAEGSDKKEEGSESK